MGRNTEFEILKVVQHNLPLQTEKCCNMASDPNLIDNLQANVMQPDFHAR